MKHPRTLTGETVTVEQWGSGPVQILRRADGEIVTSHDVPAGLSPVEYAEGIVEVYGGRLVLGYADAGVRTDEIGVEDDGQDDDGEQLDAAPVEDGPIVHKVSLPIRDGARGLCGATSGRATALDGEVTCPGCRGEVERLVDDGRDYVEVDVPAVVHKVYIPYGGDARALCGATSGPSVMRSEDVTCQACRTKLEQPLESGAADDCPSWCDQAEAHRVPGLDVDHLSATASVHLAAHVDDAESMGCLALYLFQAANAGEPVVMLDGPDVRSGARLTLAEAELLRRRLGELLATARKAGVRG